MRIGPSGRRVTMAVILAAALFPGLAGCGHLAAPDPDRAESSEDRRPDSADPGLPVDPNLIGEVVGSPASRTADGVIKVSWARTDLSVHVAGTRLSPVAGLTSWAAFSGGEDGAMLMGDTVVLEDEVDPAMDAALGSGLEVTALHNHFSGEEPRVFFMHMGGHGSPESLARGVRAVWDAIRAAGGPGAKHPAPLPDPVAEPSPLDPAAIGGIIGEEVAVTDGVLKVTIGREARMGAMRAGGSMGITTWAAISGSRERAVIDGDFAMTADEVQAVLRSLRKGGLRVVALHNHMIGEDPPYYFVHFQGEGTDLQLAGSFRAALDAQLGARSASRP